MEWSGVEWSWSEIWISAALGGVGMDSYIPSLGGSIAGVCYRVYKTKATDTTDSDYGAYISRLMPGERQQFSYFTYVVCIH